ncbi:MAG: hypothetical protein ACXV9P_04835 [Acidimicrobiia bacterium]
MGDESDRQDPAEGDDRTFNQWVTFLASSPADDDPAWALLEKRVLEGRPHEQWAIVRAFSKRPISDAALAHLGTRIVEPLLESDDDDVLREIRASVECDPSFSIVLGAVSSQKARHAIARALNDS